MKRFLFLLLIIFVSLYSIVFADTNSYTKDGRRIHASSIESPTGNLLSIGSNGSAPVSFVDENGIAYGVKHHDNRPEILAFTHAEIIANGDEEHLPIRRFGHNHDVGTTIETMWHTGGIKSYLAAGERLQVASDDTDDDVLGTGARTLWIQGLNDALVIINETVDMDGTTNVLTANTYYRILKLKVYETGSQNINDGNITISNNADTAVLTSIEAESGESNDGYFTVPAGCCAFLSSFYMAENSSKGTEISLWSRDNTSGHPMSLKLMFPILDEAFVFNFPIPYRFVAGMDIEIRVKAVLAGANTSGGFGGWRTVPE